MSKLKESLDFIRVKFDYENDKEQNEEKIKILEDHNLKMYDKITILEKQINR